MRNDLRFGLCTLVSLAVCGAIVSGCGDSSSGSSAPTGPAADLSEEISDGNNAFLGEGAVSGVAEAGYEQHEYIATGTATSYAAVGALSGDGHWTFEPNDTAPYRTRVLVRRPADARSFSGTVVVEWLNVSGGLDANPEWTSLQEEITRQGHVWVGVSAQLIGVAGGPVLVVAPGGQLFAGKGLKTINPSRYGSLDHPGDGFSFDIYTQVARALREGTPALGDLRPRWVLAAGESQSAIALTTYYNGVQPLTQVFDGFFVHSRGFVALPLVGPGQYADLAGSLGGAPVTFRTDLEAPVIDLQAESDLTGVLASYRVRQDDSDTFRLWEVAGTSHADRHLLGLVADLVQCGAPINDGPLHVVAKAAFRALDEWVRSGELPASAPRIEIAAGAVVRDRDGIAVSGIRTPPVDVPVDTLSGNPGPRVDLLCLLLGSTTPLAESRLAELYSSRADYEQRYAGAVDQAIAAGFVLPEDRAALLGFARPDRIAQ